MAGGNWFDNMRQNASPSEGAAGRAHEKKKPHAQGHAKKHAGGDDHGGGGGHESDDTLWLYSFNDMLFNLLLFFIVMYSISQVDEKKFAEVQQALQGDKKPQLLKDDDDDKDGVVIGPRNGALDAKQLGSSGGEAGGDKSAEIASAIRFMLERSEKAEVKLAKGSGKEAEKREESTKKSKYLSGSNIPFPMQLAFTSKEFFIPKTADLSVEGKENITQLAKEVANQTELGRVEIEVHTQFTEAIINSPKAESSFAELRLSTSRAGVIFEYFLKSGIPHKKVVSAGYADGRPMLSLTNMTPKQRSEFAESNERIVVTLKKEKAQ